MNALDYYSELITWVLSHAQDTNMFLVQSVVTCGALFWLLHRAWLTLWKPVPELISILGVEVPDPPEVSLAGIKVDAVTLHWSRPGVNKPVLKYLIQVNGVNVGESSRQETAITVTGLKPSHFYNVRVIAVGNNNFQAGSRVIRLRTYGRDGKPELGNGRVPSNFTIEDLQNETLVDSSDEGAGVRSLGAGIEAAAVPIEAPAMTREPSGSHLGQRRNTIGRKHSPSTASEHPPMPVQTYASKLPDESMQQLTERFESIRGETEEVVSLFVKDTEEFKAQMAELIKERDEKRQMLKEKEEASEKLKKEVHYTERSNRQAQNRKSQKEKALREKQAERTKMHDDMSKWRKEIQDMQKEKEEWEKERENIAKATENKAEDMRGILRKRQNSLNTMEEEIRVKGLQIKELEEERQKLPGVEADEESKALDIAERQRDIQWDHKERDLMTRYNSQTIVYRNLESDLQKATAFYSQLSARQIPNPIMYQGNSSGVDFDQSGQARPKPRRSRQRKSRTNTVSSPVAVYPIENSPYQSAGTYNNMNTTTSPTFAAGPYFDMSTDMGMTPLPDHTGMSEADVAILTAGAPLSPTATLLLPSNIFADDEPPSPQAASRTLGPSLFASFHPSIYDNDPQSPESSSRSASLISSPQTSSNNLHMLPPYQGVSNDSDQRSLHSSGAEFGVIGSPSSSGAQPAPAKRFGDLFSFPKSRIKLGHGDSPALGSLKAGQSRSFPRQAEENELSALGRARRTSFSSGWGGLPFLNRGSSDVAEGNAPAPARNVARRRKGFNVFGSSIDDPSQVYAERDPSSPRPASIASSDLPRPSTDSAPFGWPAADSGIVRNSPLATNWSINASQGWSRNPSRRPSIQHGSSTQLSSGIADEDDEFLPADTLSQQTSPPPVGVIGSRPISSQSQMNAAPKLNPNAPTFKAMFSRSKNDKGEKGERKGKGKGKDYPDYFTDDNGPPPSINDISPSASRASRDTHSIHTQISVTESYDSLDPTLSNSPSDLATPSAKEKENSFQKLLRKGSSSKFSIGSFRGKDFLGGKKGSGGPNSDRNASGDRSNSFGDFEEGSEDLLGRSVDSMTSSPHVSSMGSTGTPKEGRMSVNWGRFGIKKGKGRRESTDTERERETERASETEGTEDEEHRDDFAT